MSGQSVSTTAPVAATGPATAVRRAGAGRLAPLVVVVGALLLVVAGTLPVWGMRLLAPQYPKGLDLWFLGGRSEGPVDEVNALNHYIGMRPIDLATVPELGLWPLAVIGAAVLFVIAVLVRSWLGRLALIGLWLVPVGVLGDIQRWLMIYGSQLDPQSALRLDPFVPLVVGPSTVWNFTIWAYPGPALALFWGVAVLAMIGRRAARPSGSVALATAAAALAIALAGTLLVVVPAVRSTDASDASAAAALRDPPAGTVDLARLIEAAPAGAIIVVPAGSYRVHLVIDRPITLVAGGEVLLDGGGRGTVLTITAADVTVRGFRVAHTGGQVEEAAAIKTVDADRATIEENRIEDWFTGIAINGGTGVRIIGNELVGSGQVASDAGHAIGSAVAGPTGNSAAPSPAGDPHAGHGTGAGPGGQGDGIMLWNVSGALIRENLIRDVRDGVYLNYADDVLLDGNRIERSRYAVHAMFGSTITVFGNEVRDNLSGLVFMNTSAVLAGRNVIVDGRSPGTGFGIVVKDVNTIRLAENLIARNRVGLQAEGTVNRLSAEAVVTSNRFEANDVGVALMPSADLVFGGNIFDANLTQVMSLGIGVERHNFWTYQGVGNTWSDYGGYDIAGDGIGDVAYRSGGVDDLLVTADPALGALRTSPAMTVLATSQAIWAGDRPPVVRDDSPRTQQVGTAAVPRADPMPGDEAPELAGVLWRLGGLALLVPALIGLAAPWRQTLRPRPIR